MNIIDVHKKEDTLKVRVKGPFNLAVNKLISSRITPSIEDLTLNLKRCKIIDSEAIIFMYKWQQSGKSLKILNPPDIMFEVIQILELDKHWKLDVSNTKTQKHAKT